VEVATDICRAFGLNPAKLIAHVEDRLINDQRYYMDSSKLELLGWAPTMHGVRFWTGFCTLEDVIGSYACSLEALACV
jgi:dTDP-D-glucose 4,6-dehydratase